MQVKTDTPAKLPVIVRAWGDEPVALFAYITDNNRVYVGSENCKHPIGLPADQVFVFDEGTFSKLSTAFQHGDKGKIGELYANIPVDDFAWNKMEARFTEEPF